MEGYTAGVMSMLTPSWKYHVRVTKPATNVQERHADSGIGSQGR